MPSIHTGLPSALAVAAALTIAACEDSDDAQQTPEQERDAIQEELGPDDAQEDDEVPLADENDTAKGATPGVKGDQERPGEIR